MRWGIGLLLFLAACHRPLATIQFRSFDYGGTTAPEFRLQVEGNACFAKNAYYATLNGVQLHGGGATQSHEVLNGSRPWQRATECDGLSYSLDASAPWPADDGHAVFELRENPETEPRVTVELENALANVEIAWTLPADGRLRRGDPFKLMYRPGALDVSPQNTSLIVTTPPTAGLIEGAVSADAKAGESLLRFAISSSARPAAVRCEGVPSCSTSFSIAGGPLLRIEILP